MIETVPVFVWQFMIKFNSDNPYYVQMNVFIKYMKQIRFTYHRLKIDVHRHALKVVLVINLDKYAY